MVKPKKHLGQHFLKDKNIAEDIVKLLSGHQNYAYVLEIGAGTGILSDFLLKKPDFQTYLLEIDKESIDFLKKKYPDSQDKIMEGDFLELKPDDLFKGEKFGIIGNFPYHISSQILFKILDYKDLIPEVVCMLQKEVAQRIASAPKNKDYGILSVFLQAYYDINYIFTVEPEVFYPPPKVKSGILTLKRNAVQKLACDEKLFRVVVKQGFNQRRKTLRNSLKSFNLSEELKQNPILNKRPEELSVADFVYLTNLIGKNQ